MEEKKQIQYKFKILTIGDSSVGKTSILYYYNNKKFPQNQLATIGIDLVKKDIEIQNKVVRLQIWDSAGQERFRSITKNYYRNANGILLVFDMSDFSTFNKIGRWLEDIKFETENIPILLVGNKKDLVHSDLEEKLRIFTEEAKNNNIKFYAVSAKEGTNIDELFEDLTLKMIDKCDFEEDNSSDSSKIVSKRRFCC